MLSQSTHFDICHIFCSDSPTTYIFGISPVLNFFLQMSQRQRQCQWFQNLGDQSQLCSAGCALFLRFFPLASTSRNTRVRLDYKHIDLPVTWKCWATASSGLSQKLRISVFGCFASCVSRWVSLVTKWCRGLANCMCWESHDYAMPATKGFPVVLSVVPVLRNETMASQWK